LDEQMSIVPNPSSTGQTQAHGRNFGLDLVRALAITMVFCSHGVTAMRTLAVGVDLFFVLSGFLIGRIYFRSRRDGSFSLWRFWQMRWWRTLPPYFAALLLFAVNPRTFPVDPVRWYYALFLQNYVGVVGFSPSWSLCVEEHFYLLLPLLAGLAFLVAGKKSFLWLLPIVALVPMVLRFAFLLSPHGLPANWFWMTHFHSEGLTLGVFLAYLFVYRRDLWDRIRPLALGLAAAPFLLVSLVTVHPIPNMRFNAVIFLLYAVGYAGFLRVVYDLRWQPRFALARLAKRSIQGLALCAYSIYLVHTLLFQDIRYLIDGMARGPLKSGIILGASLVFGILFYFLFEKPSIDMRDRYVERRRAAATVLTPSEPEVQPAKPALQPAKPALRPADAA
jgi:peptidoglycan/LPS O-acetylase OafA/YrhL